MTNAIIQETEVRAIIEERQGHIYLHLHDCAPKTQENQWKKYQNYVELSG